MSRTVVIADASPLIVLARIGHIDLLKALFGEVIITDVVRAEISSGGHADSIPVEASIQAGWMSVSSVVENEQTGDVTTRLSGLDAGEKASIQLALALDQAALLVIDEVKGRRAARDLSLELIGSAGVIALAKRKGLIPKALPLFKEMRRSGYYLSDVVVEMALKIAGEL